MVPGPVKDGGTIAIRVHKSFHGRDAEIRGIRITTADHGGGITPANVFRIFEPFFTTKGERGTGLASGWRSAIPGDRIRIIIRFLPGQEHSAHAARSPRPQPRSAARQEEVRGGY